MRGAHWLLPLLLAASVPAYSQPARVHAAGSLRAALEEMGRAYSQERKGAQVDFAFGASGLLRERLASGEASDVFASANMEHPRALSDAGKAGRVRMYARNRLCALARADAGVTTDNLLERLLDPAVKLGTSTPKADPSGDYAWQLFARAEAVKPGARATLEAKALQLTGGPQSPPPPRDRNVYGMLISTGQADVFLTYCTNAVAARREEAALEVIEVPDALSVGADYGLVVMAGARPAGLAFAEFVLGERGQAVLRWHGFAPPAP